MIKGDDVIIDNDVVFKRPNSIKLGNHIAIDKGFYCTTSLEIGDFVHISPYVTCIGGEMGKFIVKGFNNIILPLNHLQISKTLRILIN